MMPKDTNTQDGKYTKGREIRWQDGVDQVIKELETRRNNQKIRILDVGCGDGTFLHFLKQKAKKKGVNLDRISYVGLDSDNSHKKGVINNGGEFILSDASRFSLKIKPRKFDFIVASDIIEHLDQTDDFIVQLKKVLKKDGLIYLTTPNLAAWHCRLMLLLGLQPLPTEVSTISSTFGKGIVGNKMYGDKTLHHLRVFTYKAMKEFLEYHNLEIVKALGIGYRKFDKLLFRKRLVGLSPVMSLLLRKKNG